MAWLISAAPTHAQGCGPSNPNCIVPTAPAAANNNQAASTAFVVRAIGNLSAITALTGDGAATGPGSVPFTLATVNGNVGSFGSTTQCVSLTVNAKGLITAASAATCAPAFSSLTGAAAAAQIAASPASHAVPVDVAGTPTWKVVPDCIDSVGQHINYTQSSDVWSCGTTSSGSSGLSGQNLVRNAGLGLTTLVSTVLVNAPSARVSITGWAQQGGANSGNVRFTTSGGNAGLQPGKLVAILGQFSGAISATCTITGGNTITCPTSTFTSSQGDLLWITGGTNTSPRTQYRIVSNTGAGAVLTVNGGLTNQSSVTVIATTIQGGYPSAVDATVDGIPQAGNVNAPAFFYYPLQVTAVGTNFFDAQMAGSNLNVGTTSAAAAYEVTNGNQNTGCIGPDWWSCTGTLSCYKMRGTDWDGSTVVNKPGSLYSYKCVKGASGEEDFWQDLATAAPAPENIQNYTGLANFYGKTLTCGSYLWAPNASQGRIYLNDGTTKTYSSYVTSGSLQWVEVSATMSTSASAVQFGEAFGAGSLGDAFIHTQPICRFGSGTIGAGNYLPAPPSLHMFVNHTNPFYYIAQSVAAATDINIEQETSGAIPSGIESIQADIGGINTNAASLIFLEDSGGSPQMSACASPNPSLTAGFQGNQTCMVGITKRGSGDGSFVLDSQHIFVNNSHWTDVTIDYLGAVY